MRLLVVGTSFFEDDFGVAERGVDDPSPLLLRNARVWLTRQGGLLARASA